MFGWTAANTRFSYPDKLFVSINPSVHTAQKEKPMSPTIFMSTFSLSVQGRQYSHVAWRRRTLLPASNTNNSQPSKSDGELFRKSKSLAENSKSSYSRIGNAPTQAMTIQGYELTNNSLLHSNPHVILDFFIRGHFGRRLQADGGIRHNTLRQVPQESPTYKSMRCTCRSCTTKHSDRGDTIFSTHAWRLTNCFWYRCTKYSSKRNHASDFLYRL